MKDKIIKKSPFFKLWLKICLIIIVPALLFFLVLGIYFFYVLISITFYASGTHKEIDISDPKKIVVIQEFSGITFPSQIMWHNACEGGFQDKFIICKFSATKNDIHQMFFNFKPQWNNVERYLQNDSMLSWFTPDNIQNFQSAQFYNNAKYKYISVLYENIQNKKDTDLSLVYMIIASN
jgi:hypothetical protein